MAQPVVHFKSEAGTQASFERSTGNFSIGR